MIANRVSIVVSVYNKERFIRSCAQTILAQTYENWEAIFVDDGSTDESVKILTQFDDSRIRIVRLEKNSGVSAARNAGTKVATGDFLCFLDADDLWLPEKLAAQLAFMQQKQCAFAFTDYAYGDENGNLTGKQSHVPPTISYAQALKNTTIFTSTTMFDLRKIEKPTLFMPNVGYEDTATWWQVLKAVGVGYGLQQTLSIYRRSEKTLSSNKLKGVKRMWHLYRKIETLSVMKSLYCLFCYMVKATIRRL